MTFYRNIKTGLLYKVLEIAVYTETEEQLVVYESLLSGVILATPLEKFYNNQFELIFQEPSQN